MHIRFKHFTQHGNVQHHAGDTLDLPSEYALAHVDAGNAVEVTPAEFAVMPRYETATAPQVPRRVKKAPKKPAKKGR